VGHGYWVALHVASELVPQNLLDRFARSSSLRISRQLESVHNSHAKFVSIELSYELFELDCFLYRHSYRDWPGIVLSIFALEGYSAGLDRVDCLIRFFELVGQTHHGFKRWK
jgi:hypothetical protein